MAKHPRPKEQIDEPLIANLMFTKQLAPLLERLHDVGTERDRPLYMDQYCLLIFTFCFNPVVTSLRGMQQASELKKVQKKLGCAPRRARSPKRPMCSTPTLLRQIASELGEQLRPIRDISQGHVNHLLTAVDGSVQKRLTTIAGAAYQTNRYGEAKQGWRI